MEFIIGLIALSLLFLLYFLPTIIGQHKKNANAIWVTNLVFGWTFIGWWAALIWALCKD